MNFVPEDIIKYIHIQYEENIHMRKKESCIFSSSRYRLYKNQIIQNKICWPVHSLSSKKKLKSSQTEGNSLSTSWAVLFIYKPKSKGQVWMPDLNWSYKPRHK